MLTANVIAKENSFDFSDEIKGSIFVVGDFETAQKVSSNYFDNFHLKPFRSLNQSLEISLIGDIVAMAYFEGVIYFSAFGKATVQIIRGGITKNILDSDEGAMSASGYPKEGDVIILKTQKGKITLKFESKKVFSFNIPVKFNNKIYLKNQVDEKVSSESKKMTLFVGIGLLVLLFLFVGIGINKKRNNDLKTKYEGILLSAQTNIDTAVNLATSDPEKSREHFKIAQSEIDKINELNVNDPKVNEVKNKIEDSKQSILGEYEGNSDLFLDLSLLSSGFSGDVLSVTGGKVYIMDKDGKKIVSVEVNTKKSRVVVGPDEINNPQDLGAYEDNVYVLESDGVYEVSSGKDKIVDLSWEGTAFIRLFGANMYVLDKNGNRIIRYQAGSQGFSEGQDWLSTKTQVDFSDAKMWGIDGAVYVLYPNSKILKYSQGSSQAFRLGGILPEVGNADAIYADPNNTYLYLLDRAGKRIVVTDKSGKYKAQYFDEKIGDAINLAVSETDKKIILLTGEKLMQIEIRHLN